MNGTETLCVSKFCEALQNSTPTADMTMEAKDNLMTLVIRSLVEAGHTKWNHMTYEKRLAQQQRITYLYEYTFRYLDKICAKKISGPEEEAKSSVTFAGSNTITEGSPDPAAETPNATNPPDPEHVSLQDDGYQI